MENEMTTNYVLTTAEGLRQFYAEFASLLADIDYLGLTEYEIEVETAD